MSRLGGGGQDGVYAGMVGGSVGDGDGGVYDGWVGGGDSYCSIELRNKIDHGYLEHLIHTGSNHLNTFFNCTFSRFSAYNTRAQMYTHACTHTHTHTPHTHTHTTHTCACTHNITQHTHTHTHTCISEQWD